MGTFTASHIHPALPGIAGPVIFSLVPVVKGDSATGWWPIPDSSKTDLGAGNLYVNAHSTVFPSGEIRSQNTSGPDTAQFEIDEIGAAYCIHLGNDTTRPSVIRLIGVNSHQMPVITVRLGCIFNHQACDTVDDESGGVDTTCVPATTFTLSPNWTFADSVFTKTIGARTVLASVNATPGNTPGAVSPYALYANYPNPLNPATQINFDLKEGGTVKLSMYDLTGRHVADVVNSAMVSGHNSRGKFVQMPPFHNSNYGDLPRRHSQLRVTKKSGLSSSPLFASLGSL